MVCCGAGTRTSTAAGAGASTRTSALLQRGAVLLVGRLRALPAGLRVQEVQLGEPLLVSARAARPSSESAGGGAEAAAKLPDAAPQGVSGSTRRHHCGGPGRWPSARWPAAPVPRKVHRGSRPSQRPRPPGPLRRDSPAPGGQDHRGHGRPAPVPALPRHGGGGLAACPACEGQGSRKAGSGLRIACPQCGLRGYRVHVPCGHCMGQGVVRDPRCPDCARLADGGPSPKPPAAPPQAGTFSQIWAKMYRHGINNSPCLAYPYLPTPPSFPLVGCASGAPGMSLLHCSVSGLDGGGQRPSPLPRGIQVDTPAVGRRSELCNSENLHKKFADCKPPWPPMTTYGGTQMCRA